MKWLDREKHPSNSWKKHLINYLKGFTTEEQITIKNFIRLNTWVPHPRLRNDYVDLVTKQIVKENKIPIAYKYFKMCKGTSDHIILHQWLKYRVGEIKPEVMKEMVKDRFIDMLRYLETGR